MSSSSILGGDANSASSISAEVKDTPPDSRNAAWIGQIDNNILDYPISPSCHRFCPTRNI